MDQKSIDRLIGLEQRFDDLNRDFHTEASHLMLAIEGMKHQCDHLFPDGRPAVEATSIADVCMICNWHSFVPG